ncbi:hypothetical protein D9M68_506700 [compost metagenome]
MAALYWPTTSKNPWIPAGKNLLLPLADKKMTMLIFLLMRNPQVQLLPAKVPTLS